MSIAAIFDGISTAITGTISGRSRGQCADGFFHSAAWSARPSCRRPAGQRAFGEVWDGLDPIFDGGVHGVLSVVFRFGGGGAQSDRCAVRAGVPVHHPGRSAGRPGARRALSLAEYRRVDHAGGRARDQSGGGARTDILGDRGGSLFSPDDNRSGFVQSLAGARGIVRADGTGILRGTPLFAQSGVALGVAQRTPQHGSNGDFGGVSARMDAAAVRRVLVLPAGCLDRLRPGLGLRDGVGQPDVPVLRAYRVGAQDRIAGVGDQYAIGTSGASRQQRRVYRQKFRRRADDMGPPVRNLPGGADRRRDSLWVGACAIVAGG